MPNTTDPSPWEHPLRTSVLSLILDPPIYGSLPPNAHFPISPVILTEDTMIPNHRLMWQMGPNLQFNMEVDQLKDSLVRILSAWEA